MRHVVLSGAIATGPRRMVHPTAPAGLIAPPGLRRDRRSRDAGTGASRANSAASSPGGADIVRRAVGTGERLHEASAVASFPVGFASIVEPPIVIEQGNRRAAAVSSKDAILDDTRNASGARRTGESFRGDTGEAPSALRPDFGSAVSPHHPAGASSPPPARRSARSRRPHPDCHGSARAAPRQASVA
jgi:hypothetical protein